MSLQFYFFFKILAVFLAYNIIDMTWLCFVKLALLSRNAI